MKRKVPKNLEPHRFKPGQSGNPKGRPRNPVLNVLRKATKQQFRRIIRAVVKGNVDYLEMLATSKTHSVLEVAIAASLIKAIQRGDYGTIEHILQRIVGKIPDELVVRSRNVNANLNSNIEHAKVKAALEEIEKEI